MSSELSFSHVPHPAASSTDEIDAILANPGFGKHYTDHMVRIDYTPEQGWHDATVTPYAELSLPPSASVFHYGQAIFEGLKAYRQPDGSIATFRPAANAQRFQDSARRMAMQPLPTELFLQSLEELVAVDHRFVPAAGGEASLYLRPVMIATEPTLGVHPSASYTYILLASPAGAYFAGGINPVSVWLCEDYVRACPGGTGAAKFAGNYAASLLAQAQAAEQGCDQVVWLDALEHAYVEEMGGMNLMFVFADSDGNLTVETPELSGSLLPGVTRRSLLQVAEDLGYATAQRRISVAEWRERAADGSLKEVFACGTAAVITPVGTVKSSEGNFTIGDGTPGAVTLALREHLTGIQRGSVADTHGWMHTLRAAH
ncbi:branched-chain amino acid aminotransferase [Corynebacterium choanae]|uniref:branched-chain-amino-acid transaminase n=1 Tax=Corynebacterium choanae TaxID=1862358 RepID=A0A3G6J7M6_9CORY|nr:branched-chain amino acid aminotransferase [Corynebacterium choanae]AZA13986.1 Branched-chain-amino-acid aminotransferase [Corynebacterium choanae]